VPVKLRTEKIEPVSIYKDLDWEPYSDDIVHHFDSQQVNMFDGELGNAINTVNIPRGWKFKAQQLVIYSTDFHQRATMERAAVPGISNTPQDPTLTGYNSNEADDEFTFRVLWNGQTTALGGGAVKVTYQVDEGEILLPFYKIRMINAFSTQTITFPYIFEEGENLLILVDRASSTVAGQWYAYSIRITVRLIGQLLLKNVNEV